VDDKFKLNLGCGYNRLEGWLNLDVSAESAADRVMPAHDLDLPDRCAPAARAAQLVEHLGFFRTRFFLSECWRVLEPGAELTLETPDVEKSFRTFLEGGRQAREAALGWIFGAETPGMNHLYCFPRELLEELLAGAGFSGPVVEEFMFQPHRPAMRLTAKKLAGEGPALNAALRRRLLDEGVPLFRDEEESAGLESAITGLLRSSGPAERLELALVSAPAALACFSRPARNWRSGSRRPARPPLTCGPCPPAPRTRPLSPPGSSAGGACCAWPWRAGRRRAWRPRTARPPFIRPERCCPGLSGTGPAPVCGTGAEYCNLIVRD